MRKIDDHAFWAGKPSKGCVMPDGAKTKSMDQERAGKWLNKYEDTQEAAHAAQKRSMSKAKSQDMKDGYRY